MSAIVSEDLVKVEYEKRGYTCLEDIPKNKKYPIKCQDKNGYLYNIKYHDMLKASSHDIVAKGNPYTIDNIRLYLKNNNIDIELLSDEYNGNAKKMLWKCSCGDEFETTWAAILVGKISCTKCSRKRYFESHCTSEFEVIKKHFKENGYILVSEKYIPGTHLQYICPKHKDKGVQEVGWMQVKTKNTKCPYCASETNGKKKRLPIEIVKQNTENVGLVFKDTIYSSDYTELHVLAECEKHLDYGTFNIGYSIIREGRGCPVCNNTFKTPEFFIKEIQRRGLPIKVVSKITRFIDKADFECLICGYKWTTTPSCILVGQGCRQCAIKRNGEKKREIHKENFIKIFKDKYSDRFELLGEYVNCKEHISILCKKHNLKFKATPDLIVNGNPKYLCPKCVGESTGERCRFSQEEFEKMLKEISPYIEVLGEYKGNHIKVQCRCKIHDYTWDASPSHLIYRKTGCPKCGNNYTGEIKIDEIFKCMGYSLIPQKRYDDCRDKYPLPFDRFCEELNLIIEYDGEWHYMPIPFIDKEEARKHLKTMQYHDTIKNEYCKTNNINIIRVPYWEKGNMENYIKDEMRKLNLL